MSQPVILLLKTHVEGYTRRDGTVVKPHEDKRVKKLVHTKPGGDHPDKMYVYTKPGATVQGAKYFERTMLTASRNFGEHLVSTGAAEPVPADELNSKTILR